MHFDFNRKNKSLSSSWSHVLSISVFLILIFLVFGKLKSGYHMDEYLTFNLSNHSFKSTGRISLFIEEGVSYNGQEFWDTFLTLKKNTRFDYPNVWVNQEHDVHPPLFYVLIHTVSSLFPQISVKKVGLLTNIPLAIIVFWQLVYILERLDLRKKTAVLLAAAFILSSGFINNNIIFFRMYTLMSIWVNFLMMIFLKYRAESKGCIRYYALLGIVLIGGILTQYYFLIYAFFACLVYAVYTARAHNWKKITLSIITVAVSGVLSYLIFPGMKYHIFESYRGKQAFENAASSDILFKLWAYLGFINSDIFGGLFVVLPSVMICLAIVLTGKKKSELTLYPYVLLVLPVCMYVIVIAKVSPYLELRYCISCVGLLYAGFFCLLVKLSDCFSENAHRYILILAMIILFSSYRSIPSNLYPEEKDYVSVLHENSTLPCLYLYKDRWKITPNLSEIRQMDDIIFIKTDNWEKNKSYVVQNEPMIVFIDSNNKSMINTVLEYTGLKKSEVLFTSGYVTVYSLS